MTAPGPGADQWGEPRGGLGGSAVGQFGTADRPPGERGRLGESVRPRVRQGRVGVFGAGPGVALDGRGEGEDRVQMGGGVALAQATRGGQPLAGVGAGARV